MTSPAATPLAHFPVLDHGFVELWNTMGTDQTIAASARVSLHRELASLTDTSEKQAERDRGLINRLMRDRHTSPFESVVFQWRVRAPIFVARQWFRHRFSCLSADTRISILNSNGNATKALSRSIGHLGRLWSVGEVNGHDHTVAFSAAKADVEDGTSLNSACRRHHVSKAKLAKYMRGVWQPVTMRSGQSRVRNMKLRVLNEETQEFTVGHIECLVDSGIKPIYQVTLDGGYLIKMTAEHRVLTTEGWQTLRDAVGLVNERENASATRDAFLMVNGTPVYRDQVWLADRRSLGYSVQQMADEAGCAYETIRKWLKVYGLSFSPEETRFKPGQAVWNAGVKGYKTKRVVSEEERQKLRELHSGDKSNFWRGGTATEREKIGAWTTRVAPHVHSRFNYTCQVCQRPRSVLHAHHAIPVWLDPSLAMEFGNLVSVCDDCHRQLHQDRDAELGFAQAWKPELGLDPALFPVKVGQRLRCHAKKVLSVEYAGMEQTYDLVMQGPWHNFVANGIVVHNSLNEESGRYVELQDEFYAPEQLRVRVGKAMDYSYADMDAAQNAAFIARIEALYRDARALYEDMLAAGVAREHARIVLPVAQYTTFIWTVNALSLMNFLHLRNSPHAQAEIRAYAAIMEDVFAERLPWTHAAFREHWGVGMI